MTLPLTRIHASTPVDPICISNGAAPSVSISTTTGAYLFTAPTGATVSGTATLVTDPHDACLVQFSASGHGFSMSGFYDKAGCGTASFLTATLAGVTYDVAANWVTCPA